MKKTIKIIMLIVCSIVLFTGCDKSDVTEKEEYISLEQYKSYCGSLAVHSEFEGDYSKIYYYEYESGREIYACGQANCSHTTADYASGKINCNAVIKGEVKYPFVYQNKLYYFVVGINDLVLWKSNTDGTDKEVVAELDYTLDYCVNAFVKGKIYITSSVENEVESNEYKSYVTNAGTEIYSINIENGKTEQITEFGKNAESNITYIRYFNNKLFFVYRSSAKTYEEAGFEDTEDYLAWMTSDDFSYKKDIERRGKTEKCYTYDLSTKKVERLDIDFESNFEPYKGIDDMDSYYVLGYANDTLYYLDPVVAKYAIYSYNVKTKERKELLSFCVTLESFIGDKIYVTGYSMDESTKDELIPSVDINKDPEYYIIDTKTGKVTKQEYGEKGKTLYVVDECDTGLVAYTKDFDATYNVLDEHSMCVIPKKKIKN